MSPFSAQLTAIKANRQANLGKTPLKTPVKLFGNGGVGLSVAASILPAIEFGNEVAWVLRPSDICAGRIGSTAKGCLKSIGACAVETHSRSKSVFRTKPFLIHLSSAPSAARGFDKVLLETDGLDKALVTDYMSRTGENWSREFEEVRVSHTKTIQDRDTVRNS